MEKENEKAETKTSPKLPFKKLIRSKTDTISEVYVKSLTDKPDYIYEIDFSKDSKLENISSSSFTNKKIYSVIFPPNLKSILVDSMRDFNYLFQVTFLKDENDENFLESIGSSAFLNTDI
mgnify:CR=1 FL=1